MRVVDISAVGISSWVKRHQYPDGQVGFEIIDPTPTHLVKQVVVYASLTGTSQVVETTLLLDTILRHYHNASISLRIGYLYGGRSDREFDRSGVPSFAIGRMLMSVVGSDDRISVEVLDPHSPDALRGFAGVPVSIVYHRGILANLPSDPTFIIPDAGARTRVTELLGHIAAPVVQVEKYRSADGRVYVSATGQGLERALEWNRRAVIIDDLCDGGRTYLEIARLCYLAGAREVELRVTHGVFSQNLGPLFGAGITKVYCTNSFRGDMEATRVVDWRMAWKDFTPPPR